MAMRYDDPNISLSTVVGIISVVLLVVTILLLEGLFFGMNSAEAQRKLEAENEALEQLESDQSDLLEEYGWVDQQAGVVRIPVDRAAELVVQEAAAASEG